MVLAPQSLTLNKQSLIIPRQPANGMFSRRMPKFDAEGELIRGGMFESQREWWELPSFVRMFVGGYGSGKTLMLCKRMIEMSIYNAPIPCAIVSPTYSFARQTTVRTLCEVLDGQIPIQAFWGNRLTYKYRRASPFEFEITYNGRKGTILVYSGQEADKLKGPNLASAGIDEPFIQDVEVFKQMTYRLRHRKAKRVEINLCGTPEQLNWGYDLAEGEMKEQFDDSGGVGLVQMSTDENRALNKAYYAQLEATLDEKALLAYKHGAFVNLAKGLYCYGFNRLDNVVDLDKPEHAVWGAGMDFNVDPMASAVFWLDMRGENVRHIHYVEDIEIPNSDTQDMCAYLHNKYYAQGMRDIYPDASGKARRSNAPAGKTDYDYIRAAGFEVNANKANPAPRDRFNATNALLRPYQDQIRMTISPKCKRLIAYMQKYSHELSNQEAQKKMRHLLDAATYPIAYLCPSNSSALRLLNIRGV